MKPSSVFTKDERKLFFCTFQSEVELPYNQVGKLLPYGYLKGASCSKFVILILFSPAEPAKRFQKSLLAARCDISSILLIKTWPQINHNTHNINTRYNLN
ncbi:MAG TPA: hypothetical protein VI146_05970 [Nitrososphaeraceae archaeon]